MSTATCGTTLRHTALGAVLALSFVACSGNATGTNDTPVNRATATSAPSPRLPAPGTPTVVEVTSDGVAGLASNGVVLVWASGPGSELWASGIDGSNRHRVWIAPHPNGFLGYIQMSGDWAVMSETLPPSNQGTQYPSAWYVWAVDVSTGATVKLDGAQSLPGIAEPAVPTIEGTLVAWNAPRPSGTAGETLRTYDLATRQTTTVPLAATVYPVHPQLHHGVIYFMDNGTDHHRTNETAISRGGQVSGWDAARGTLSRLPSSLDAFNAEVADNSVIWLDRDTQELFTLPLAGGAPRQLGPCTTPLIRGDAIALCLPPEQRQMIEYVLANGASHPMSTAVDFGAPSLIVGDVLYAGGPRLTITALNLQS